LAEKRREFCRKGQKDKTLIAIIYLFFVTLCSYIIYTGLFMFREDV